MSTIEMKKRALKHLVFYINELENATIKPEITMSYSSATAILFLIYNGLKLISDDEYNELNKKINKLHTDAWERM